MRKILLGAVAMAGLVVLTASDVSAAQSNGLAASHAAPVHGMATDVYYRRYWHHRHWHHWRRWHRWHGY
jgi:hypothetical protein